MSRATKRREAREQAKKSTPFGSKPHYVKLTNPVGEHFPAFVVGNVLQWEALAHNQLIADNLAVAESLEPYMGMMGMYEGEFSDPIAASKYYQFVNAVSDHCKEKYVVEPGSGKGQTLVICGAGPSLRDTATEWCPKGDQVWGCNSALTYLVNNGHKVTHGYTVDQTPQMLTEWLSAPDVEYLIATTVSPHLTEYLLSKERKIRFFHNYVGIQGEDVVMPNDDGSIRTMMYEDWMYSALMPYTMRCGSGLNATSRAIDLAMFMEFDKVYVLGADCAMRIDKPAPDTTYGSPEHLKWLRENVVMHADGGHAMASGATATTMGGTIDGRHWETKADLMITAIWLVRMVRKLEGKVELIGDTLPNALMNKDDEFLNRLPQMVDANDAPIMVP